MTLSKIALSLIIFFAWHINCSYAEIRAMWITRYQLDTPEKIDQFVQKAKENGFNAIFVQVLGRGVAFYDSKIIPKAKVSFDPLKYTVEKSHKAGIKIHAWLNAYYVWSSPSAPESSFHIVNKRPDWILYDRKMQFLNPSIEGVKHHLYSIYMEVAQNYEVDGIHFDYIRYPGISSGFDLESRRKFSNSYWLDPIYLAYDPKLVIDYYGTAGYRKLLEKWTDYRCSQVTELVNRISFGIRQLNKNIKISAAVFPNLKNAKSERGQDWEKWLDQGTIDFVVPMIYSENLDYVKKTITNIASISHKSIIGLGAFKMPARDLIKQIHTLRKLNKYSFAGFSLFSYDTISSTMWYMEKIKKYAF